VDGQTFRDIEGYGVERWLGELAGQEFVGLGWYCSGKEETFRFWHDGWDHGYLAAMLMLPASGKGVVVMVNADQGWVMRGEIAEAVGREYGWLTLKDSPRIGNIDPIFAYAGSYEGAGGSIRMTQESKRLLVGFASQPPLSVYPAAAGEFFSMAINLRLRFAGSEPSSPSELTVVHGHKSELFKRTE
jgi:hypothetical protein